MTLKLIGSTLLALLVASACVQPVDSTEPNEEQAYESQALAGPPGALLVVGSATLSAGDAALNDRLQSLGFTVTVRSGVAVTAADAGGKVVVISESVTSGDVNTKLRNVAVPVVSMEPSLFDDLGLVEAAATNYGTTASQNSLLLLAAPGSAAGDVTITVTSSSQTFAWAKPVPSATRIATLAGDASRSAIFSFEQGSALSGLTAPARRAGWFATGATPTAFNANAWSLFAGLMRWAKAGLPTACSSNSDCPGTSCVSGTCSSTCAAGSVSCAGSCVNLSNSSSNCGACGNACAAGKICSAGACTTSCASNSDCPGTSCVSGTCSNTCAAGSISCAGSCVNPSNSSSNCGACGNACPVGKVCQASQCI